MEKQTQLNLNLNELHSRLCPECKKVFCEMVGAAVLANKTGIKQS